jgi:predicted HTH transcriptional regulator
MSLMSVFDSFAALREDNKLEYKSAKGGFPRSFWETYSAFANTDGGTIVLGAVEGTDGLPVPSGAKDPDKLQKELWDGLNNRKKTSTNILLDSDVSVDVVDNSSILVVRVPRAKREQRPVFINNDMLGGSYRRNGEGDYHCTRREINAMVRDSFPSDDDKRVLDNMSMDALDPESIRAYRQEFRDERPRHPWVDFGNDEFLVRLGAVARSEEDGLLHPTHAGLLMFGQEWRITDEYPEYFLDCRQVFSERRWDNRIVSNTGEWSGNVYDFYGRAYRMLSDSLPVPFELGPGMRRIDDTPQHKAVREALANALVHADYYDRCGIVAIRYDDRVEIRNPGGLRMSVEEVVAGGVSDARNGTLMKMFNLLGIGEKAGSGFDVMRASTRSAGIPDPTIVERHEPDMVTLVLPLETSGLRYTTRDNPADNRTQISDDSRNRTQISDDSRNRTQISDDSGKGEGATTRRKAAILAFIQDHQHVSRRKIADAVGLQQSRTSELLGELLREGRIVAEGSGRTRAYSIDSKDNE